MVCRVFHKSSTAKKPQPTSSSQQSEESPNCDTYTFANELGDIEPPNNFYGLATPSNGHICNNISLQNYSNENMMNMNLNMNLAAAATREAAISNTLPLLPAAWSSSLLCSNLPSVDSLLLRALQFRGYNNQPREATTSTTDYPFIQTQNISHIGIDYNNPNLAVEVPSSSMVSDPVQQQQPQEQSYKLGSNIW